MTTSSDLPELVRDSRLPADVRDNETIDARPSARRNASKYEKWLRIDIIGYGGGGVVCLQRKVDEGTGPVQLRAVKGIRIDADVDTMSVSRRFVRELEASAKFSQEKYAEYFVKSYGWYSEPGWLYITMEYCRHGDLGKYLRSNKTLPEDQVQDIAVQILEGLSLMHAEGFAHRDLKPSNILIISKPPEEDWWVKLCDLGLSRRSNDASTLTNVRGTPDFMAPETIGSPFIGDPTTANHVKADMWCLGETLARMLTGRKTFDSSTLLQYQKLLILFPEDNFKPMGTSQTGIQFIKSLMMADPFSRPDTILASKHPWIESRHGTPPLFTNSSSYISTGPSMVHSPDLEGMTEASGQWTTTLPVTNSTALETHASGERTKTQQRPYRRNIVGGDLNPTGQDLHGKRGVSLPSKPASQTSHVFHNTLRDLNKTFIAPRVETLGLPPSPIPEPAPLQRSGLPWKAQLPEAAQSHHFDSPVTTFNPNESLYTTEALPLTGVVSSTLDRYSSSSESEAQSVTHPPHSDMTFGLSDGVLSNWISSDETVTGATKKPTTLQRLQSKLFDSKAKSSKDYRGLSQKEKLVVGSLAHTDGMKRKRPRSYNPFVRKEANLFDFYIKTAANDSSSEINSMPASREPRFGPLPTGPREPTSPTPELEGRVPSPKIEALPERLYPSYPPAPSSVPPSYRQPAMNSTTFIPPATPPQGEAPHDHYEEAQKESRPWFRKHTHHLAIPAGYPESDPEEEEEAAAQSKPYPPYYV